MKEIILKYPFDQKNYRHKLTNDVIMKIKEKISLSKYNKIRKEIRDRKFELISNGENENNALNIARKEANEKYGKGWREKYLNNKKSNLTGNCNFPSIYDEHTHGEHWID
jgi:uncharacterized protein YifE (UPF0438 family)